MVFETRQFRNRIGGELFDEFFHVYSELRAFYQAGVMPGSLLEELDGIDIERPSRAPR